MQTVNFPVHRLILRHMYDMLLIDMVNYIKLLNYEHSHMIYCRC